MSAERRVTCPACQGGALFSPANPWRPFCSERCREVDLGRWAAEDYRVAKPGPVDGDDGPAARDD